MGNRNKEDDYYYSYIERKMVKGKYEPQWVKKKGRTLKKSMCILLLCGIGGGLIYFKDDIKSSYQEYLDKIDKPVTNIGGSSDYTLSSLKLNEMNAILEKSNEILTKVGELQKYCTNRYNDSDFSSQVNDEINRQLIQLNDLIASDYDIVVANEYIDYINNIVNNSKKYAEFMIMIGINSNDNTRIAREFVDTYHTEINRVNNMKLELLESNNFNYEVQSDGAISFSVR